MAAIELPEWVKVGAELISVRNSISCTFYGARTKIAKIYKTGNFLVEGSTQQWSPGRDYAVETGRHGYRHYETLRPITDELIAEKERTELVATARAAVHAEITRLQAAVRYDDQVLEIYAALRSQEPGDTR